MTSNGKTLNYKIVDLVESYNFHIKFTSIRAHAKKLQFFEYKLKTEISIVYRLFDYKDDFKWKNFELQMSRSRRMLQFSDKVYLHPSQTTKIKKIENRLNPYHRGPQR
jgi:hypothetical protein